LLLQQVHQTLSSATFFARQVRVGGLAALPGPLARLPPLDLHLQSALPPLQLVQLALPAPQLEDLTHSSLRQPRALRVLAFAGGEGSAARAVEDDSASSSALIRRPGRRAVVVRHDDEEGMRGRHVTHAEARLARDWRGAPPFETKAHEKSATATPASTSAPTPAGASAPFVKARGEGAFASFFVARGRKRKVWPLWLLTR